MTTGDRLLGALAFNCRGYCSSGMRNPGNIHTAPDDDTFALDTGEHNSGTFGIVSVERLRRRENGYRASEATEALRQLKTGRPGPDDDEMLRSLDKAENAFARQIGPAVEAGN